MSTTDGITDLFLTFLTKNFEGVLGTWIGNQFAIFVVCFALAAGFLARTKRKSIYGKHVLVTGGSSGIGKHVAIEAVKQGAHVTILARNEDRLKEAVVEIRANCNNVAQQIVSMRCVDVSQYEELSAIIEDLERTIGPIFMLVNCAGYALCGILESFTPAQVQDMFAVNYLGTLYPTQILAPKFKQRLGGIIVMTGSQASLLGIYGMSVYSSCKFALRGLAESIRMELKPFQVSVTLALPPDTDTPGFERENRTKPEETQLISGTAGLYQPDKVAAQILRDSLTGKFVSYVGLNSFILTNLCVGMTPFNTVFELIIQTVIMGVLRIVAIVCLRGFDRNIAKCHHNKNKKTDIADVPPPHIIDDE